MNELFLSFLWQYQYFNHASLHTEAGELIRIHRPGLRNTDAGPDFTQARVEIDGILWVGTVELHVRASDWNLHRHSADKAYENVILHVVWKNDLAPEQEPNRRIPTLSLQPHTDPTLLNRYRNLQENLSSIPCHAQFGNVSDLHKRLMMDRVLTERLERKTAEVLLIATGADWNETAWQLLARYFGFTVNADTFQKLARRLPLKVLLKHRDSVPQLEALLFGMAQLLPEHSEDPYPRQLSEEYRFLRTKYRLQANQLHPHEWRFFRLRPAGFPTVRLAQLAQLIHRQGPLFSSLTNPATVSDLEPVFQVKQSAYWTTHYHFGKVSPAAVPSLGKQAAHLLIINVVVPLLAAYASKTGNRAFLEKGIRLLEQLPAERNRFIHEWRALQLPAKTAADSQALLEWHHYYCTRKRCLDCHIGNALIRSDS